MIRKKKQICVICSAGGHLTEAMLAIGNVKYEKFFVTYKMPYTEGYLKDFKRYYVVNPHKYFWKYPINFIESLLIYLKERPRYIFSTGSGMAISMCFIGKLFGSKIIFLETGARIRVPSLTGRLIYHISDLFIVQWRELLSYYPKAVFGGLLF